ncbi:MAG: response regulator [Saprospiraceae bacterium]|nr:response regulator [Saprospiraceae bacterium]
MNILVVDDERDVKDLFEQRFRKEIKVGEFDFSFAFNAREAQDLLEDIDVNSMLVLSDINMPGMSGLELLKWIKEKYEVPPPVVMMITAYGDQKNYQEAMRLGADDFLTKPLDFQLLKNKLKTMSL